GTAFNTTVNSLSVLTNGDLVAAGNFTSAGGVAATNIARWNGTAWSAFGNGAMGGSPSVVYATTVSTNGDLFVTGAFTSIGGVAAAGVSRWDGVWHPLGAGIAGLCIAV